jgi:hypothetical protein
MATLQSTTVNDTGHLEIPSGTTLQRPGYVVQMFTTTGPGTFTVPSGITAVDVLVIGGGGAGGGIGGGGGGGGAVYRPALPVTPGGTVAYNIGTGGQARGYSSGNGSNGNPTTFGALTALGGGGGGGWAPGGTGLAGGSGGGGTSSGAGGAATQPGQPNPGGINYGFPGAGGGNLGGSINNATTGVGTHTGGGGGGAGAAGGHPSNIGPGDTRSNGNAGRKGGDGLISSITGINQYYAGGGGGGSHVSGYQSPVDTAPGGLGGGGRGASFDFHYDSQIGYDFPATAGQPTEYNTRAATTPGPVGWQPFGFGEPGRRNTGGGGGGGMHTGIGDDANGGGGGPGVIIVRYLTPSTDAPETGMMRYNTDSRLTEIYDGSIWKPIRRTVVEFNTTGAHFFKVPMGVTHCDVLVVAGGGAGGILGGGGGAGGHLYVPNHPISPDGVVPVYVGVGGGNQVETSSPPQFVSNKGQPSRFGGLEAYGGGSGGVHPGNQNNYPGFPTAGFDTHPGNSGDSGSRGGSGGGAAYTHPGGFGRGIPGQGFPGGDSPGSPPHGCGGGGGAGGVGGAGGGNPAGAGGIGVANSITGTSVTRGGGGGGGGHAPQSQGGAGGPGGGGGGGRYNNPVHASTYGFHQQAAGDYASPGADNTGGGGGASGHNSSNPYGVGGRGGPGVVIIRY